MNSEPIGGRMGSSRAVRSSGSERIGHLAAMEQYAQARPAERDHHDDQHPVGL